MIIFPDGFQGRYGPTSSNSSLKLHFTFDDTILCSCVENSQGDTLVIINSDEHITRTDWTGKNDSVHVATAIWNDEPTINIDNRKRKITEWLKPLSDDELHKEIYETHMTVDSMDYTWKRTAYGFALLDSHRTNIIAAINWKWSSQGPQEVTLELKSEALLSEHMIDCWVVATTILIRQTVLTSTV